MTKVKIIFDNYSSSSKRQHYIVERDLQPRSSIREVCLAVIRQAQQEGLTDLRDRAEDDAGIALYLKSEKIKDASTGYGESGFGIKYSLNLNGSLQILHGYEPLTHDWSFIELQRLVRAGYIEGDPCEIIIVLPSGLGAALQDVFDWVGFLANIYGIIVPATSIAKRIIQVIRYRKIRKVVETWTRNGIHYPSQVREFIDIKSGWKLAEIKRRLKFSDEYAIKLLISLGLEPKKNIWQLTHSKSSIANRKKWLRNEKKYINQKMIV